MAKYITISKKTKEGTKETRYRVDAEFKPNAISDICSEYIENYCVENGEVEWLLAEVQKTITDKKGNVKDNPFVNVRSAFVKKFMPQIIIGEKKTETWKDKLLAKYSK